MIVRRASRAVASKRNGVKLKRVGLFGGSFDPIHSAHIAVAEAAIKKFQLDRVIFIPSGSPPHKTRSLVSYPHRFAMVALACAQNPKFVVSAAESGADQSGRTVIYSVDTVRSFRKMFRANSVKLYFILGADQFLGIGTWKNCETLLGLCDFIVANRPGFNLKKLRNAIPARLLGATQQAGSHRVLEHISLRSTAIYPLESVSKNISATDIRRRLKRNQIISGLVPRAVEDYIRKQDLYR